MTDYLIAMTIIPALFLGWLIIQQFSRSYAKRHPEFGPAREEGMGCGKTCGCKDRGKCENQ